MKRILVVPIAALALFLPSRSQAAEKPFAGRWDLTITTPKATYPDWIEYTEENGQPHVRIQPRGGGVQTASKVEVAGARLSATILPESGKGPGTTWEVTADGDRLTGTLRRGNTVLGQIAGVRSPDLSRPEPKKWSAPVSLFNGKDLSGWEPFDASKNEWVAEDGVLLNKKHGSNLRTTKTFNDFKLHIEFNCPADGNSGIYLRGRYEVQVEYEKVDANDRFHSIGSIYGFVPPAVELPRTPGEWESFDITLVGRTVTVVRNGKLTIDHQEIPSPTGGALDSRESEPGPIYLQGDHTGGMKYRNITISVPED